MTFLGASVSGVVLMPGLVALVETSGFRHALDIAALSVLLVLLPVAATIRFPELHERPATGAAQEATPPSRASLLRDAGFLYLTAAFALAIMVQVGFIVHQISILEPVIGLKSAGGAVALTTAMALAGRVCLGIVADRIDPRRTAAVSIASQAAALTVIGFAGRTEVVVAACAVFGFSIGNLVTLPALLIQREFPPRAFSTALGLSMAIAGVINACGPAVMGVLRDAAGGYAMPIAIGVVIQVASAAALLAAPRTRQDGGAAGVALARSASPHTASTP
jgi:predicted MFS family arabinose efflux permease